MDILALALAYHRNPLRYREQVRFPGALPAAIDEVLRAAHGQHRREGDDQLQRAARFFIEQVLLAPGADYYRVLGVNRGAPLAEIKDHHRLLMRVFHPDRGDTDQQWSDGYSRRINQAYGVLRKSQTRAAYDRTLSAAPAGNRARRPASQGVASRGRKQGWVTLLRLTPARVLWATAALALLFVAQAYRGGGHPPQPEVSAGVPGAVVATPARHPQAILGVGATPAEQAAMVETARSQAPVTPPAEKPPPPRLITDERSRPLGDDPPQPPPTAARQALRETPVPNAPPAPMSPGELRSLMDRFMARYERGELEAFMALFSAPTGAALRRDYARLFRSSQARRIELGDLRWRPRGALAIGAGRYRAVVREGNDLKTYVGAIDFEVEARAGKLLINALRFSVEREPSAAGEGRHPAALADENR